MKRIFLAAGLACALWSCGDDRPSDAGAGNTENVPANNTSPGAANGANTYDGGSATNPMGGNARGQATDSVNNGGQNVQPKPGTGDSLPARNGGQ